MTSPSSEYRPDIDGLRGIAVIMVVLFHARISFHGGFIGVDVFFVISGYLITLLMMRDLELDRFTLADFWERRFRRIFPALAVMILASIGLSFLVLLPADLANFGESLRAQMLFISNFFFWNDAEDYFAGPTELKPLLHTWSLAVEEQFYILMPLLCIFIRWFWSRRSQLVSLREVSFRVFSWLFGLSFITAVVLTFIDANTSFYWLHTRAWELLLGACLACLPSFKWNSIHKYRVNFSYLAIMIILVVGWVYDRKTTFPGIAAAPPCFATAFLIWVGQPQLGINKVSRMLGSRPLVAVGLASYSFYLWHWPVLALLNYVCTSTNTMTPKYFRVLLMLFVFCLSLASLRWVETPIRKRLWLSSRRSLLTATFVVALALFGIGSVIVSNDGFPQRISPKALNYAEVIVNDQKQKPWVSNINEAFEDKLPVLGDASSDQPIHFLLWGDSHAKSIAPGIISLCEKHKVKGLLAAFGSTAPVIGGFNPNRSKGLNERTTEWGNAVIDIVRKRRIPNVIITCVWKTYAQANEEAFKRSLFETVNELKATGTKVWIMLDVPHLKFSVPNALAFYEMFPSFCPDPRQVAITLSDHEKANRVMRELTPKLKEAGVIIIDPSPYQFSSSGKALIEENSHAIFGDSNHLTVFGAHRLMPFLEVLFE